MSDPTDLTASGGVVTGADEPDRAIDQVNALELSELSQKVGRFQENTDAEDKNDIPSKKPERNSASSRLLMIGGVAAIVLLVALAVLTVTVLRDPEESAADIYNKPWPSPSKATPSAAMPPFRTEEGDEFPEYPFGLPPIMTRSTKRRGRRSTTAKKRLTKSSRTKVTARRRAPHATRRDVLHSMPRKNSTVRASNTTMTMRISMKGIKVTPPVKGSKKPTQDGDKLTSRATVRASNTTMTAKVPLREVIVTLPTKGAGTLTKGDGMLTTLLPGGTLSKDETIDQLNKTLSDVIKTTNETLGKSNETLHTVIHSENETLRMPNETVSEVIPGESVTKTMPEKNETLQISKQNVTLTMPEKNETLPMLNENMATSQDPPGRRNLEDQNYNEGSETVGGDRTI